MSVRAGTGEIVAGRFFSVITGYKVKNSDHKPSALVTEPWLPPDYNITLTKQKIYNSQNRHAPLEHKKENANFN